MKIIDFPPCNPTSSPYNTHMISNELIELLKLQSDSLAIAKMMSERWKDADAEERALLVDMYIDSRRKLPRLANGKHLGHREAYEQTR